MRRPEIALLLVLMVGMLLVGAWVLGRRSSEPATLANPVTLPTLIPTPAIIVPTPPAAPVVFNGDGNSYTYNINVTEVNTCAAVIGCWQR